MPRADSKRRSVSIDEQIVGFIEKYLKDHRVERLRSGKDLSIVSVIREALFVWAEKRGVLDELLGYLKLVE